MILLCQMGGISKIAFLALYPIKMCRDGGACPHKEDHIELGAGAIVSDVVTVGKVTVIV